MKRKLLSVAMSVVMAVACLTGCSGSGDFSKSSFISAAKKNGMEEIKETTKLSHILADDGEHIAYYYDDKDIKVFDFAGSPFSDHISASYDQGSLNAVTGEGYDPCHDEQMAPLSAAEHRDSVPAPVQTQPGLPFGWAGSDMVKGIVMSEILKRKH